MTFLSPLNFYWLTVPLLILVLLSALTRRKQNQLSDRGRLGIIVLRLLTLTFLGLTLAEPAWQSPPKQGAVTALIDVSESMDPDTGNRLLQKVKSLSETLVVDVIPFAKTAANISMSLNQLRSFEQFQGAWSKLDRGATNIQAGLESAISIGAGPVLLLTDGHETLGDASKMSASLGRRIFPVALDKAGNGTPEFAISNLEAPLVSPIQKSVEIRTSILNTSNTKQSGLLIIKHDQNEIFNQNISLNPGEEKLLVASSDPSAEGIKEIKAQLTPSDSSISASSKTIYLSGQQRERVLLFSGAPEDERLLSIALRNEQYQLITKLPEQSRDVPPDLSEFSSVIFNNISKNQLPAEMPQRIEEYVKAGGGFIMIGGNRSFGLGGYIDSPIERILPVELVPPQTEKKRLNIAVNLVLDKSRSMAESEKLDFAKEAARETIRNLKDEDFVGVIGFDASPFIVVELGPINQIRAKAIERVGRLFPAGRTNLLPAIDEARRSLMRVNAGRKHMIILTDGKVPDEGPYYIELVKQMRLLGISVSTVMLGSEADTSMLREMADAGGGAFYQTNDPRNLPKIFLADIKVGSGEKTLKEESEFYVRVGPGDLKSTKLGNFPPLRGYVQTKRKDRSNLELIVTSSSRSEPLLASWEYGQGRTIAYTSDANGRWSNYWVSWQGFQTFWSDLVSALRRTETENSDDIRFDLRYAVKHGALKLDLALFSEKTAGNALATIIGPDNQTHEVRFSQVTQGHFEAELPQAMPGKYEVRLRSGNKRLTPVAFYLPGDVFGERRGQGVDYALLERLAGSSGGKVNPTLEDLKQHETLAPEPKDLSIWFLALAAILFCLEIIIREGVIALIPNFRRSPKIIQ